MEKNKENFSEEVALNFDSHRIEINKQEENVGDELLPDTFDTPPTQKLSLKDALPQAIISCIAHCITIQAGINMAYSTILEDGLQKDFPSITLSEKSWIASLVTISLPFGSLIVGPLMDFFGRKKICLVSCVPGLISWILLIIAESLTLIYIARVIAGFSGGLSTVGLVYISEITHPQFRPMFLCFNSIFVSLGILLTYCLGVWLTWKQMAIAFLILNGCIFFMLLLIPESPYWIICFGNKDMNERQLEAESVLRRLNKSDQIFAQEVERIKEVSQNQTFNNESNDTIIKKILHFYQQLKVPTVYKPSILLFVIFLIQQLAGTYIIIFYALTVFTNIGGKFGTGLDKYGAMVILGVIRFLMSILTSFFSKNYGRRLLCLTSGLGMTFSMFFSGMYIYLTSPKGETGKAQEIMVDQQWVLLVIVLFYVCTSCLGFVIIPWTLIGELLPISVRGVMSGVMVSIAYVMMFGMVKGYPFMEASMSMKGVFFFFSASSLVGVIVMYIFLPETLGKSFSEIEKYFSDTKKSSSTSNQVHSS